jgi:hypothetical protein
MPDQIVILDSTFFRNNRLTIDGIDMLGFSGSHTPTRWAFVFYVDPT